MSDKESNRDAIAIAAAKALDVMKREPDRGHDPQHDLVVGHRGLDHHLAAALIKRVIVHDLDGAPRQPVGAGQRRAADLDGPDFGAPVAIDQPAQQAGFIDHANGAALAEPAFPAFGDQLRHERRYHLVMAEHVVEH